MKHTNIWNSHPGALNQAGNKRQAIMASAFDLFHERGYHKTKILDIAERSDIGKGTFYEYFSSKDALLVELLQSKLDMDCLALLEISNSEKTCREKIIDFYNLEMDSIKKHGPQCNVLAQEMMSPNFSGTPEIKDLIHLLFGHKHQFLQQLIREGMEKKEIRSTSPALAATSLLGAISFYSLFQLPSSGHRGMISDSSSEGEDQTEEFFKIIFSGIQGI